MPPSELGGSASVEAALQTMHAYLFDQDTATRVAAGEAITMIFVRCNLGALSSTSGAGADAGSEGGLQAILARMKEIEKNLGGGEEKRKSKGDRASLRKEFKEYLRVVDGEAPKSQKIVLPNGQTVEVESFEDIVFLNYMRGLLADGFLPSMLGNPIMQQVLDFEPVEHEVDRFCVDQKRRSEQARAKDRRSKLNSFSF